VANLTNCNGFWFQLNEGGNSPRLLCGCNPTGACSSAVSDAYAINAAQSIRTPMPVWFGINTAVWDGAFDTAETISQLNESALTTLRFPADQNRIF